MPKTTGLPGGLDTDVVSSSSRTRGSLFDSVGASPGRHSVAGLVYQPHHLRCPQAPVSAVSTTLFSDLFLCASVHCQLSSRTFNTILCSYLKSMTEAAPSVISTEDTHCPICRHRLPWLTRRSIEPAQLPGQCLRSELQYACLARLWLHQALLAASTTIFHLHLPCIM